MSLVFKYFISDVSEEELEKIVNDNHLRDLGAVNTSRKYYLSTKDTPKFRPDCTVIRYCPEDKILWTDIDLEKKAS